MALLIIISTGIWVLTIINYYQYSDNNSVEFIRNSSKEFLFLSYIKCYDDNINNNYCNLLRYDIATSTTETSTIGMLSAPSHL